MAEEQRIHRTWLHSDRAVPSRFVRPALKFTHIEASGGVVLLLAAVAALIWANAPFGESYTTFWETHVTVELGSFHFDESLKLIVNDALMAIFFFVVGLEVKRELVVGELNTRRKAMLPAIAALGGMIVPALIYVAFTASTGGEAARGWGIPMATDIAFSVGVVSLLGRRVPVGAKLFLLALAIADDIGAIAVIAIFYTTSLAYGWLAAGLAGFGVIWLANRVGIRSMAFYWVAAITVWFCILESGVHATLAGVALGLMTPVFAMYSDEDYRRRATWILDRYDMDAASPEADDRLDENALALAAIATESVAPLERLEHSLHPWTSFLIVPLFALANAGIRFEGIDVVDTVTSSVALGVTLGLVVGKLFGITIATWLAVRFGLGELPKRTTWSHVVGLAALAGIGFTVSLFITELAFTEELIAAEAKVGIFIGSAVAGVIGYLILRRQKTPEEALEAARTAMTTGVPGQ
jgi:NhaA family Na+:H+ antiporter